MFKKNIKKTDLQEKRIMYALKFFLNFFTYIQTLYSIIKVTRNNERFCKNTRMNNNKNLYITLECTLYVKQIYTTILHFLNGQKRVSFTPFHLRFIFKLFLTFFLETIHFFVECLKVKVFFSAYWGNKKEEYY